MPARLVTRRLTSTAKPAVGSVVYKPKAAFGFWRYWFSAGASAVGM